MRASQSVLLLALSLPLAGCFSQADIAASFQADSDIALAQEYHMVWNPSTYSTMIKQIMTARNLVPATEWPDIDHHVVEIGMNSIAVEASWGDPSTINTTTDAQGSLDQWVYRSCDTCADASYVYLTNGVVTATQTSE